MRGVRIKDHWKEQRLFDQRALVASAIAAVLLLILAGRLVLLQVTRYDYYSQQSQYNRVRVEPIPAARGLLLDRNGQTLAGGQPGYQLELVREEVPDLNATLKGLVNIGLLTPEEVPDIRRTILSRRSFDSVPIRLRMTDEDVGRFAVHRFDFPGVDIKSRQTRWYPNGALAVHALGYVSALSETDLQHVDTAAYAGTSVIGKLGVEGAYEKQLHGTNGYRQILVNAEGRSVEKIGSSNQQLRTQVPVAGENLVLGLDLKVQRAAEDALGTHRGAVVALDPRNGDVIALVSKPGFDPTEFARGITRTEYAALSNDPDKPLLNRALRGAYPSGSTIKPAIGLVALTDHSITADQKVLCNGTFQLPHSAHIFRADKTEPRGLLDLTVAIAKSSDVYFYKLAHEMGIDKLDEGLAPFGYGELTGIDISGEKPGLLPSPAWKKTAFKHPADQVWFPGETVNLGVGQGYLLVTPLQLAHIVGVIGERGLSFRPRLVTGTRSSDGRVTAAAPVAQKPVEGISEVDWTTVIKAMMGTMTYGTGRFAFAKAAYNAAGKTGTAQVYSVGQNEKYNAKTVAENLRDHAWFVAFAPAEQPRIAIAVLVENVGFGGENAAPVARTVLDAYLLGSDGKLKPEFEPSAQAQQRLDAARPAQPDAPRAGGNAMIREEISEGPSARRAVTGAARMLLALKLDGPLMVGLGLIAAYGLVVLYSASGQSLGTVIRQVGHLGMGTAAMLLLAQVNPNFLRRLSPWLYLLGVILLLIVAGMGAIGKGAQRWLDLGVLRFQPSEIMKLAVPMMCAWYLHERPLPPSPISLILLAVMIMLPAGLVVLQPDLGTGALIAISGALVVMMAGLQAGVVLGLLALAAVGGWVGWHHMHDYQRDRILTFINPQIDPQGAGYHIIQSQIAIGSGGVFGKGWMNGSQAQLDYLPESSTDFIFAVIGEEFGMLGLFILLLLYAFVVGRAIYLSTQTQDTFARLLAGSLALTFFVYVFINAGMVSGLLPVVGVPLPLISYGGTSMVTLLAGFGILMSMYSHRKLVGS